MKIVCGACGRKYSIADEKVQGKVFKIRCRNCSNVIVVKGNSQGAESEGVSQGGGAGFGAETSSAAEWYVVIDGEQKGPLTAEEVEARFTVGQIQADSYIWRDGMGDWQHVSAIDTFAHLTADGGHAEEATMIAESPMGHGGEDAAPDDATAIVDAQEWRESQGLGSGSSAGVSDNDPTNAMSVSADFGADGGGADGFGDYVPASAGSSGYDDGGYGSSDYGAGDYGSSDYGSADMGGGGGYGEASMSADGGYGSSDYGSSDYGSSDYGGGGGGYGGAGAGMASYESNASDMGGDNGMFANFDMDAGNSGGLAYQSFSGIDSAGDVDLGHGANGSNGSNGANGGGGGGGGFQADGFSNANDMIGSRNENSVLFSLSSLQQVEAVKGPSDDVPLTEGSGLIDIQSLASTHQQMSGGGGGGFDSFGGGPSSSSPAADSFSPGTMSMPAIMPRGSHRDNKGLIIGVSVAAVVLIGAMVAVILLVLNKEPEKPQVVVQKEVIREVVKDDSGSAEKLAAAEKAAADAKAKLEAQQAALAEKEDENAEEDDKDDKKKSTRKSGSSRKSSSSKSDDKKDDTPSSKDSGTRKGKPSDIDSLLDKIDNKDKPKDSGKTAVSSSSSKPQKLSKSQVQGTIRKYNGRISTCARNNNSGGLKGKVWVSIDVSPNGRVSSADIISKSAKFRGTDVGNCVTKVVRGMKFPEAQESLSISQYPFIL